jgi:pyridoxal 5'-phosphate synthase pdxT subunit
MKVGVLALQGAYIEHINLLHSVNVEAIPIRLPSQLALLDALIIPGGESTTISKLLITYNLFEPIIKLANQNFPILGICAGMVLLAKSTYNNDVKTLGVMDIDIKRNAYGRQVNSFEIDLHIPVIGDDVFRGIFIRAPVVNKFGNGIQVLCTLKDQPVAFKQKNLIACSFHPELTNDLRLHRYFIGMAQGDIIAESNNR